jgi:D-alanyl-D-alanine carboxypeptidase/D-alanyl-D-alanine-endopeptidase (penicillin-binding protein 4)
MTLRNRVSVRRWGVGRAALTTWLWALCLTLSAVAQSAEPTADEARILAASGLAPESTAFIVFDAKDGTVLSAFNPDLPVIPASTMKVPTTVAALAILGADYRFSTIVTAKGTVDGGVLKGDLTLIAGGDPFLDGVDLRSLARQLADAGIAQVDGRFLVDDSVLVEEPAIDPTQPYAASYNQGLSALTVNFNRFQLSWRKNGRGFDLAAASMSDLGPVPMPWVALVQGDAAPYRPVPGSEGWVITTRLQKDGADTLPVRHPTMTGAEIFRQICARSGVTLPSAERGLAPPDGTVVARHDSITLAEMIPPILDNSNNLATELVAMVAAQSLTGTPVDRAQSGALLAGWYQGRLPQMVWTGMTIAASSGLSTVARITPRQMAAVLIFGRSGETPDLLEMLPEMAWGRDGTRLRGMSPGRLHVKTGTMYFVRGLAGYLETDSGRLLGFAAFSADMERRMALDQSADPEDIGIPAGAHAWRARVRGFEQLLLERWAGVY